MSTKCAQCGGANLESGKLRTTFTLDHPSFLSYNEMTVMAAACLDCGHLQFHVDPAKLAKKIPHQRPDPRRGFPIEPPTPQARPPE